MRKIHFDIIKFLINTKKLIMSKENIKILTFSSILSIIGVFFVLISAFLYGAGMSSDSVKYIGIARNIISGNGYFNYDGDLVPSFPPLFPLVLAFFGMFGVDPFHLVLFFNAFAFGLIIFFSNRLFFDHLKSKLLAMIGSLAILLSIPLLFVSKMAWSEPLFILLITLFIAYFLKFLQEDNNNRIKFLIIVSVISSLACIQRYIGITLIITSCILLLIFTPNSHLLQKIKHIILFSIISAAPLIVWMIRNYIYTSTLAGSRHSSPYTLIDNIINVIDVLSGWFIPSSLIPLFYRALIICSLMIILFSAILFVHIKIERLEKRDLSLIWINLYFVLIYSSALIISSTIIEYDGINNRILSPIYVSIMLLVFIGIENLSKLANSYLNSKVIRKYLFPIACTLWLIFPLRVNINNSINDLQVGVGGYNITNYRESELIE